MKTVIVNVTKDDLSGEGGDVRDCPGFRAVRRVVPSLDYWIFSYGETVSNSIILVTESDSREVSNILINHTIYQASNKGKKASPFSFAIEVPDEVETTEES